MKANGRLVNGVLQHIGPRLRQGKLATTIANAFSRATYANVGDVVANLGHQIVQHGQGVG